MTEHPRAVVIGAGNTLLSDDGFGPAVLARLQETWCLSPDVELVDGGTWGMNLLPAIEDADALIIVDVIDVGWSPGTPVELERDNIPRLLGIKLSPHQIDLRETLAVAELRGKLPRRAVAIGVQPLTLETHIGLTPLVEQRVDWAVQHVVARLKRWGWMCGRRPEGCVCTS
jgi:hydrogenase maturation protease